MTAASLPVILRYVPGAILAFATWYWTGQQFDRLAVVVPGLERGGVRVHVLRVLGELLADPLERHVQRPLVEPVHEAEREEVLAAVGFLRAELVLGHRLAGELGDRHADDAVALEAVVFERADLVPGLVEVGDAEVVGIDDQDAAGLQILEVRLERRGVHHDQGVEVRRRACGCRRR